MFDEKSGLIDHKCCCVDMTWNVEDITYFITNLFSTQLFVQLFRVVGGGVWGGGEGRCNNSKFMCIL